MGNRLQVPDPKTGGSDYYIYDYENRASTVQEPAAGVSYLYAYDPWGKRIMTQWSPDGINTSATLAFYGANDQLLSLGALSFSNLGGHYNFQVSGVGTANIYFGSRLIWHQGAGVFVDRLGTTYSGTASHYPWGESGTSEFATYLDDMPGQYYADQRYYNPDAGRFYTPDPLKAGPNGWNLKDPGSWNMYVYASDDPENHNDPSGLHDEGPRWQFCNLGGLPFPIVYCAGIGAGNDGAAATVIVDSKNAAARMFRHNWLNTIQREQAALAIQNLSENCLHALEAAGADPGQVGVKASSTEYYRTVFEGDLRVQQVSGYNLAGPGETLSQYLGGSPAASLLGPGAEYITNQVVLGTGYFGESAIGQNATLVHEALHTYLNQDDIELAATLGLGDFRAAGAAYASAVITGFLLPTGYQMSYNGVAVAGTDCTK